MFRLISSFLVPSFILYSILFPPSNHQYIWGNEVIHHPCTGAFFFHIYHSDAPSEKEGREVLDDVTEKWEEKYPRAMKRWYDNWDVISPIFKFSSDVRKVIYTTNAIESLNSTYRKLNRQRSVFPSDTALLKALYLSTFEATKKWTMPVQNWGKVYGELAIMYDGRLPE